MIKKTDIILALISGALLVPAFPPLDYYLCAWIALVPFLMSLRDKTTGAAFLLGIIAGFVYFMGTVYWVSHSMYYYGYLPAVVSFLILILLCLYLGLYIGIFSMLFSFVQKNSRVPAVFTVPVLWVFLEYLRTYALTGFPWSLIGYSQYKFLSLIQIADVTGIYGISFLVAAFNGALFDIVVNMQKKSGEKPAFPRWPFISGIAIYAVIMVAVISYGAVKLQETDNGQKIKISVVQGNIEQDKKWDKRFQGEVIDKYKALTIKASKSSPDIIVWPETAVPFIFDYDKSPTEEVVTFQKGLAAHLLFGSVVVKEIKPGNSMMANSAVLLSPDGSIISIYDKMHLVPYGEYVPLRKFFPFIEKLTVGIGDFYSGKEPVVMKTPFAKIGNLICYEIIFPELARALALKGANLMVTITNDAWFGKTSAPYQHFSMAVFRAIENRVPVARAANTGISGFIDSKGRILNESDIFVETTLTQEVSVGEEQSFYTRNGDLFAYFCIFSSVVLITRRLFS